MTLLSLKNNFIKTLDSIYPKEEINSFFYLLMDFKLQLKRVDTALNLNQEIEIADQSFFKDALKQLQKEIPIQYIIGKTEFFGLPFYVDKNTLIPRPETEELVSWILEEVSKKLPLRTQSRSKIKILDIGTGTGCIAISIAKNLKNAEVWALDVSKKALTVAQKNAGLNKVDIHFIDEDILKINSLSSVIANEMKQSANNKEITSSLTPRNDNFKFDIIISNPPYVRMLEKQEINNNVLLNEPHVALFVDDSNPLLFYDKIAELAIKSLTKNGILFFEINQYLGKETVELLKNKGFTNIELRKDIFDNDRMIKINLK